MTDQSLKTAPVLVTGASGHTGSRLVLALLKQNVAVRILTRDPAKVDANIRLKVEMFCGDLNIKEDAEGAAAGCRAIISVTHIKMAPAILAAMQATGVRRGIFMSSTRRYTKFVEATARQVIAGEQAVEQSGLDWTIIRPTMIYGGAQDKNLEPLMATLKKWPFFPLPGGGEMLWQPVFTWDVVSALVAALERNISIGHPYTVAGPEAITYREMLETMIQEAGLSTRLVPLPLGAARMIVSLYEKFAANPRIRLDQIRRMEENKDFDISDARRDLNFDPISFREGIRRKVQGQA